MNSTNLASWARLWRAAGARGKPAPGYHDLKRRYRQPHRAYHNLTHLRECLAQFHSARHLANDPASVEMALWFHDAVYDPHAADNEERSADFAGEVLARAACQPRLIRSVRSLILATKHRRSPRPGDAALIVDVDLSILGTPPARFERFEKDVRREYAWVPARIFSGKRAEILRSFLKRRRIFTTTLFRKRYERRARRNLTVSIAKLEAAARSL